MKEIFLSTSLVIALALSGCGSDSANDNALTTNAATGLVSQVEDMNVTEGIKKVAHWLTGNLNYAITGGNDQSKFELTASDGNTTLQFKNTQNYLENDNNSYKVEVSATKPDNANSGRLIYFTVNVVRASDSKADTTAPVFTTTAAQTVAVGGTVALTATDASAVTFSIPAGTAMFTLTGSTLTPQFVTGSHSVVVTATDTAGNASDKTIAVGITQNTNTALSWSPIEDNRFTWTQADAACTAMANGPWRLPTIAEMRAYSDTLRTMLPASGQNSVVWSSDDANDTANKMGWGYFIMPEPDSSAQPITAPYYFSCVQ